tara:strand:- start:146 stop:265 length:120 start_codon:yes stop_codon:yes gene_type:complete
MIEGGLVAFFSPAVKLHFEQEIQFGFKRYELKTRTSCVK